MINDVEIQSAPDPQAAIDNLISTARELSAALLIHADAVAAAAGDADLLVAADEGLAGLLRAADGAYAALTGEDHPMRAEELYCHAAAAEDELPEINEVPETVLISVIQRHDLAITSEPALVAAGRAAYAATYPDEGTDAAEREVTDAGSALQHLGLVEGWSNLWRAAGIEAIGGVVAVLPQDEPLQGDPEGWADDVLDAVVADDVDPIYVQVDVYGE